MNDKIELRTETGERFEIPEEGSLGLLALGYTGILLWREKRNQLKRERLQKESEEK